MKYTTPHSFHIPVMGTAFTIDTPIKLAPYGIASVVSINDDELCETMRQVWSQRCNYDYSPIKKSESDYRAKRITAYLNLMNDIVQYRFNQIRNSSFLPGSRLTQYFEQLSPRHPLKIAYLTMMKLADSNYKQTLQDQLRQLMKPGSIDVNIMTKLDRDNYDRKTGNKRDAYYSDAISALRGYADSHLTNSAIIFSAGFNRRLYSHLENCDDFYPDETGTIKKRIILKVSDFRSSQIQGTFLAKKGLWIYENRIESGLNCGGHAFPTQGMIMGPILEAFKANRASLSTQLFDTCNAALLKNNRHTYKEKPEFRVTFQGGIGTAEEDKFLLNYYELDGTGWASPFLLVPEATTVDTYTRHQLARSQEKDLYLSDVSPLGVPFNTMKQTKSDDEKWARVDHGKPGSPCPKGHLVSNTEFTKVPICTASRTYQRLKVKSLDPDSPAYDTQKQAIYNKACLCEDLAAPAFVENDVTAPRVTASAVCPGPNIAYFGHLFSLEAMIGHIYGRLSLINPTKRTSMFIKELQLYVDYFKKQVEASTQSFENNRKKYLLDFKKNLNDGIAYYHTLLKKMPTTILSADDVKQLALFQAELNTLYNSPK